MNSPLSGAKKTAISPPMLTQAYRLTRSRLSASSISRQYQAVWLICSKLLSMAARRNSQKFCETAQIRQATAQPKKSPIMVVYFRPILSVRIPPKKEQSTCTTMAMEVIRPICTSVIPCVYM